MGDHQYGFLRPPGTFDGRPHCPHGGVLGERGVEHQFGLCAPLCGVEHRVGGVAGDGHRRNTAVGQGERGILAAGVGGADTAHDQDYALDPRPRSSFQSEPGEHRRQHRIRGSCPTGRRGPSCPPLRWSAVRGCGSRRQRYRPAPVTTAATARAGNEAARGHRRDRSRLNTGMPRRSPPACPSTVRRRPSGSPGGSHRSKPRTSSRTSIPSAAQCLSTCATSRSCASEPGKRGPSVASRSSSATMKSLSMSADSPRRWGGHRRGHFRTRRPRVADSAGNVGRKCSVW